MARQRAHHHVTLVAAAMARQDLVATGLVATGLVAEGRAIEQTRGALAAAGFLAIATTRL